MVDTQTNTATEPEVVCNHKPGDVWADGCCTSKKNKSVVTEDTLDADVSAGNNTSEQVLSRTKD